MLRVEKSAEEQDRGDKTERGHLPTQLLTGSQTLKTATVTLRLAKLLSVQRRTFSEARKKRVRNDSEVDHKRSGDVD